LKVRVKLHPVAGLPLPPMPSQPLAQRKLPSSAATLCVPPTLVQVTVSPAVIVRFLGLKEVPGPAVTL
jgi:hypothetical protein